MTGALDVAAELRKRAIIEAQAAEQLAHTPEFADGTWRGDNGRNLFLTLVDVLGPEIAARLWRLAEGIFEANHLGSALKGAPLAQQRSDCAMPAELRIVRDGAVPS